MKLMVQRLRDRYWLIINSFLIVIGFIIANRSYSTVLILLIWFGLIFYGIDKNKEAGNALSISNANALRGISAIEIMLGHIGIATSNIYQFPNRKAGILFVGVFFMISGYGLAYGYYNKPNYLNGFIKNRFTKLLLPAILVIIVETIINHDFSWSMFFSGARWYVWELLVLYVLFYVTYRLFDKNKLCILTFLCIVIILIAYYIGLDNPWYGSTLCFSLGIAYYKYKSKSQNLTSIKRLLIVIGLFIILGISILSFFVYEDTFIGNVLSRNLASFIFCSIVLLMLEKFNMNNSFSNGLAKISYEIYLVHPLIILIVRLLNINSAYIFTVTVIIITIAVSVLFRLFLNTIYRLNSSRQ